MPETDAISLRVTPYGESDLIVTFLAVETGKLRGMARGARNSRRRFGAGLDPGNRGIVSFKVQARSDLATIEGFQSVRPPGMGSDPVLGYASSSVALEATDLLSVEGEDSHERFALLAAYFDSLASGRDAVVTLAMFLAATLVEAGFAPSFERCTRCGGPLTRSSRFDASRSSVTCAACPCDAAVATIEPALAERIGQLTPDSTDRVAAQLACELLAATVVQVASRPLKSLDFFRKATHT